MPEVRCSRASAKQSDWSDHRVPALPRTIHGFRRRRGLDAHFSSSQPHWTLDRHHSLNCLGNPSVFHPASSHAREWEHQCRSIRPGRIDLAPNRLLRIGWRRNSRCFLGASLVQSDAPMAVRLVVRRAQFFRQAGCDVHADMTLCGIPEDVAHCCKVRAHFLDLSKPERRDFQLLQDRTDRRQN